MPRSSLIMTVFNREDLVGEAIESALAQSDPDFELIIWDDGSTDGTLQIARRYASSDDRIRVFSDKNQGRVGALISAIEQSQSPFFGILDSDDRLHEEALAKTLPVIERDPDTGIVYTDFQNISMTGADLGPGWNRDAPYNPEKLIVEQVVFHFRLFNREIYDEVGGFDPAFLSAEDYDLVLRISEVSDIVKVPEILYDYRVHEASLSWQGDVEQIRWSQRAAEAALTRRGMSDKLRILVRIHASFQLTERS
ncbi:MAG: glycosyltransferase [Pseudomonadota bacterium]